MKPVSPAARRFASCLLFLATVGPAHAQFLGLDWGLQTRHDYQIIDVDGEGELRSLDSAAATLEAWQQAGPTTIRYRLSGGIGYSPQQGRVSPQGDRELIVYPGPSGLRFTWPPVGQGAALLAVEIGRVELSDPSGLLLVNPRALSVEQLADGMRFEVRYPQLYGSVAIGYTGLLDKDVNRVLMSGSDAEEALDAGTYFAPRRLLSSINVQAGSLFLGQNAGLIAVIQQDLRGGSDTFSSYYFGPMVEGPVRGGFFQRSTLIGAYTSAGSGGSGMSVLGVGRLSYDIPVDRLEAGWFQVRWASSAGKVLKAFPAAAGPPAGRVFREPLSDLVDLQLGIDALLPVPPRGARLVPAVSLTGMFVPSGETAAVSSIDPNGTYAGLEAAVSVEFLVHEGFSLRGEGAWHLLDGDVRSALGLLVRITL